jgi:hypothetical protein
MSTQAGGESTQNERPSVAQEQIIFLAAKLLDSLEEAEDNLWDADEEEVAELIGKSLKAVAAMLDEVREKMPQTEEDRIAIARGLVACQDRAVLGIGGRDLGRETVPFASDSPPRRTVPDEFSASMERAREDILVELRSSSAGISREEAMVEQLRVMEAALDDVKEAITSVDADDLRQALN